MRFSLISKRSEHVRQFENLFRSETNMFILKNIMIEAKRSKLILNCESSEAKRTQLFPKNKSAKRSELVYYKILQYRSEANRFDSDFVFKTTTKKRIFVFFKNERQKTKGFDSKLSKFCHCYTLQSHKNKGLGLFGQGEGKLWAGPPKKKIGSANRKSHIFVVLNIWVIATCYL